MLSTFAVSSTNTLAVAALQQAAFEVKRAIAEGETLNGNVRVANRIGELAQAQTMDLFPEWTVRRDRDGELPVIQMKSSRSYCYSCKLMSWEEAKTAPSMRYVYLVVTYVTLLHRPVKTTEEHNILMMTGKELVRRNLDQMLGNPQPLGYCNL